jgi:hypothetical protein
MAAHWYDFAPDHLPHVKEKGADLGPRMNAPKWGLLPIMLAATLLVAIFFASISWFIPLKNYCAQDEPGYFFRSKSGESKPPQAPNPVEAILAKALDLLGLERQTHQEAGSAHEGEKLWSRAFVCDLKLSDLLVVTFTFWLVIIGAWQGYQLKRTVDSAREEFVAAHRPKVVVRREQVRNSDTEPGISYVIANVGESEARNIRANINVRSIPASEASRFLHESIPTYRSAPWEELSKQLDKPTFKSGERAFLFFKADDLVPARWASVVRGDHRLFFFGLIQYEDSTGVTRESAFFRTYQVATSAFEKREDDPDYEHT